MWSSGNEKLLQREGAHNGAVQAHYRRRGPKLHDNSTGAVGAVQLGFTGIGALTGRARRASISLSEGSAMPARLTVIRGRDVDQVYRIEDAQATVLGRSVKCDIRVSDSQASRMHCRIQRIDGQWTIADTASRNGTFVNKERVTQATLRSGDLVRVGTALYEFQIEGEPVEDLPGGTDVLIEPGSSDLEVLIQPEDLAPSAERDDAVEPLSVCAQCARELPPDAVARREATSIGGRLYCNRCVVHHSDSESGTPPNRPQHLSESSEMQSLLQSLERATEADRADGSLQPPPTEPPKRKLGLLDRLRGRKSDA